MPFPPFNHASSDRPSMPLQTQGKRRTVAQDVPVKRFRVSRACDQCRTERSKCDGNQPQCAPCFDSNRPCTYTSNPKKRGLPPGYIRGIELALALVFQQNPEIEASFIARLGQENTVLLARDTKESNRLHKNWRKSKFCKELNRTLTGEQGPIDKEDVSSAEDSDAGLEQETNIPSAVSEVPSQPVLHSPQEHRETRHRQVMQQDMQYASLTPLPPNCWQLLEAYSIYTQCWLPISEKLDVLKLSYSYPSQGLQLSPGMPESGQHAEMWSIFALGSCQDAHTQTYPEHNHLMSTRRLYDTARSMIPTELGKFDLGHVKALLNLALVNLRSSLYDAAWILAGAASRIIPTIGESVRVASSRYPHVVSSCYLLDNLMAISLNRRPHFNKSDLERAGRVEEDGLEEWQPWVGELETTTGHSSRLPTLSLSTFNRVVDLVDVLVTARGLSGASADAVQRLSDWKSALSPKFDYIRTDSTTVPLTPPAVLLQLTYFATNLACTPSLMWLQRTLELLEMCQERMGTGRLPPIMICLLYTIKLSSKSLPLDQAAQTRIEGAINSYAIVSNIGYREAQHAATTGVANYGRGEIAHPGPAHVSPHSFPDRFNNPVADRQHHHARPSSLLGELIPDMNPGPQAQTATFSPDAINTDFTSPALDAYDPSISGDLESFFDELATLHGAKKLQNQPQFMQNLGFAPEVSMADLLATQSGQYMPMNNSTFGTEHEGEPLQFPLSDYYDAG
jgi:hypothetical protein